MRRALENRQVSDVVLDCRPHLHPGSTGADHADAFAPIVCAMIPTRGVECGARKAFQTLDLRHFRPVEHSNRADHSIGCGLIG